MSDPVLDAARRLKYELCAAAVLREAERLRDVLAARALERRYNPDWASQPRVPAGSAGGGQWTDGGGGSDVLIGSDSERVILGGARSDGLPVVPVGGFGKGDLGLTVQEFVSANCKAGIYGVLPGQFLGMTIAEVMAIARSGDAAARRCLKLLDRDKYRK